MNKFLNLKNFLCSIFAASFLVVQICRASSKEIPSPIQPMSCTIEFGGKPVKVPCLTVSNYSIGSQKEANHMAIVFFPGFRGFPGGVPDEKQALSYLQKISKEAVSDKYNGIKLIFPQWPGCSTKVDDVEYRFNPSGLDYKKLHEYDAALLMKLKQANGDKLNIIAHSISGLRILHAFLTLTPEEREGMFILLVDPFIPSQVKENIPFTPFYTNILSSKYLGRNFLRLLSHLLDKKSSFLVNLLVNSRRMETEVVRLLSEIPDEALNLQLLVLTRKVKNPKKDGFNGFGSRENYSEFLETVLTPKLAPEHKNTLSLEKTHSNFNLLAWWGLKFIQDNNENKERNGK